MNEWQAVVHFWFEEIDRSQWWKKDPQFDREIAQRFGDLHRRAAACELFAWRSEALGRLAEILILDQFSRNIYRDQAQAFAQDTLAVALVQEAVAAGADRALDVSQRCFLYMPLMHSESLVIHQQAETLFSQPGLENYLNFERKHKVIIERFGRYPHRNVILGRESSADELEFLKEPGSSF